MRDLVIPSALGIGVTILLLLAIVGAGRYVARAPAIPWVCDDTRYVDTVPVGRGFV